MQDEIATAIVNALAGEFGMGSEKAVTVEVATENLDAYEIYLTARELFTKRDQLPESIRLFRKAVELDPNFARAREGLAAVEAVADDWVSGDAIYHKPLAVIAGNKALALNPDLSMPLAALGSAAAELQHDYKSGFEFLAAAIEKDPRNSMAWLRQGLQQMQTGFIEDAVHSLEKCLEIDPAYQNCRQHLANNHLSLGHTDKAMELFNLTMEHLFHLTSGNFVSTLFRSGHRELAMHVAGARLGDDGAPVIEWIRAIENLDGDNSAGYARLKDWERREDSGLLLTFVEGLPLAFKAYDDMLADPEGTKWVLWQSDGDEFRTTPQFNSVVRELGIFKYWQEVRFPPQCKPVGDNDFECGRP